MAAIKGLQIINAGEGAEKRECRLVQPLWRTVWRFLKNWKQNCHTTQQSHFWAYNLRKSELKETHVPMLTAALFTIARTWKQPRSPLADK